MKIRRKLESLFFGKSIIRSRDEAEDMIEEEKSKVLEQVVGLFYLVFIICITLAILMELKIEYQIDIFPGINTPFDDVYQSTKDGFSGNGQPPPEQ